MLNKKLGIEVQFMDSVDGPISEENLSSQLKKVFTDAKSEHDTTDFVESSFIVSEVDQYDENFKNIFSNQINRSPADFEKSISQYNSLKPKRYSSSTTNSESGPWFKRVFKQIFG